MGRANAEGMADAMREGYASLRQVIAWHLSANHYPPVPVAMIDPCIEAIEAGNEDDYDRPIPLPEGISWRDQDEAPAWAIIEGHHLGTFLDDVDEER
jgi:hypothetical protein